MLLSIREFIKENLSSRERKVLAENFVSLSLLQGINYILPLITFPYLVRVLGPEKYGLINFAYYFIFYFMLLTDYGFKLSAVREISVCRDSIKRIRLIYSSVITIELCLFMVSVIILSLTILLFSKFRNDWLVYYIVLLMVLGHIMFPAWFFQGVEKMKYITIINIIAKTIFTVCIFIFVKNADDYIWVVLLNSLGFLIAGTLSLWILYKHFNVYFTIPTYNEIKHQLKEGWYVFISTIAISTYSNTRIFALGLLTNLTLTGYVVISEKMIGVVIAALLVPPTQALYPMLSKIYSEDPERSFRIMSKLQNLITVVYVICASVIFVFTPDIVKLIGKNIYPETVLSFRLLLIATFFTSALALRVQFLLVSDKKAIFTKIHLIAGALGIIFSFLFVYLFSYKGPAIALMIVELIVLCQTVRVVNKKVFLKAT